LPGNHNRHDKKNGNLQRRRQRPVKRAGRRARLRRVTGSSYEQEPYRLWQHLANAGMFTGMYTGVNGSGGVLHGVPGVNIPESEKIEKCRFSADEFRRRE
jgi:hypothetical protein